MCSNDDLRLTFELFGQGQSCFPVHLYGENVENYFLKCISYLWLNHTIYDKSSKTFQF